MKSHLPFVSFLDPDEVVAVHDVDYIEVFRTSNSFHEPIHIGERVTIGDGDFVDSSVVNA